MLSRVSRDTTSVHVDLRNRKLKTWNKFFVVFFIICGSSTTTLTLAMCYCPFDMGRFVKMPPGNHTDEFLVLFMLQILILALIRGLHKVLVILVIVLLSLIYLFLQSTLAIANHVQWQMENKGVFKKNSDGVIGIFQWYNPSGRTMALGSTQHLKEMSTMCISWHLYRIWYNKNSSKLQQITHKPNT